MAAFLGYCVQCLDVAKGKHTFLPYCGYVADVSPQKQGKLQITHLRRHARVVRRDPGRRAALHGAERPPGLLPSIKGNRPEILFDL